MNQVEQEHDDYEGYEEQFQSLNLDSVSIVHNKTERGRPQTRGNESHHRSKGNTAGH